MVSNNVVSDESDVLDKAALLCVQQKCDRRFPIFNNLLLYFTKHFQRGLNQFNPKDGGQFILNALLFFKMTRYPSKYYYKAPKPLMCNYLRERFAPRDLHI